MSCLELICFSSSFSEQTDFSFLNEHPEPAVTGTDERVRKALIFRVT